MRRSRPHDFGAWFIFFWWGGGGKLEHVDSV